MRFRAPRSTWITLAFLVASLSASQPAFSASDISIENFTVTGVGVTPAWRFDTQGNAVDAHDGGLSYFNGAYYLYGTSYNCGFQWLKAGSRWCGFKVYSSPDLLHWTDNGYLFDPTSSVWQSRCSVNGCFRPHVIYNPATHLYVLWANFLESDITYQYRVFESTTPAGPFTEVALPTLTFGPPSGAALRTGQNNGDFNLFEDNDGQAYIVYTAYGNTYSGGDLFVERLNSTFTSGAGRAINLSTNPAGVPVEAPAMFKRGSVYYILYGPACPYCTGTPTRYLSATNPLGPWLNGTNGTNDVLNPNSCGGQPAHVAAIPTTDGQTWMYMSDLWYAPPSPAPQNSYPNQARAAQYWTPLEFDDSGAIQPFTCSNSVTLFTVMAMPGQQNAIPGLDQTSGTDHFATWCDIGAAQRIQTFVPGRSGILSRVAVTTFRGQAMSDPYPAPNAAAIYPNADLQIDIAELDFGPPPGHLLKSFTVPAASVGLSPNEVVIQPQLPVMAGNEYGISLHSNLTQGCYGIAYNDQDYLYPPGRELYSERNSSTFLSEGIRALKFDTSVTP